MLSSVSTESISLKFFYSSSSESKCLSPAFISQHRLFPTRASRLFLYDCRVLACSSAASFVSGLSSVAERISSRVIESAMLLNGVRASGEPYALPNELKEPREPKEPRLRMELERTFRNKSHIELALLARDCDCRGSPVRLLEEPP